MLNCNKSKYFINNNCIITRTLKVNLKLNIEFLNSNNENFRENIFNSEEPICKFWNIEKNTKYLKVFVNCKNKVQKRFTNMHISQFLINNYYIIKKTLKINLYLFINFLIAICTIIKNC